MQLHLLTFSAAIVMLLSLATSGHSASVVTPSPAPTSLNGLTILTTETELVPGVTDYVSVKCSYSKPNNSDVMSVVSLVMSRWNGPTETTQELLVLTGFNPDKVIEQQDVGATVSGQLNQNGESSLSLSWNNPNKQVATRYICTVTTFDRLGHPVTTEVQTEVKIKSVDFSTLVEALKNVKDDLEKEKALNLAREKMHQRGSQNLSQALEQEQIYIQNLTQALEQEQSNIQNLTQALEQERSVNVAQENSLKQDQRNIQNLTQALDQQKGVNEAQQKIINELELFQEYGFKVTGFQFRNQFLYWSGKEFNFQDAKTACIETGGKLAELDYSLLKDCETNLKEAGIIGTRVFWIGLHRSGDSSPWVWVSNGTQPGSITWHEQPSSDQHCAYYYPGYTGYIPHKCIYRLRALCSRKV